MATKFSSLILTIGIPGSGKTTWVKEYKKTHPLTFVISTDAIRKEVTGYEQFIHPEDNQKIYEIARQRAHDILNCPDYYGGNYGFGPEIIIDSTNVDVMGWLEYKNLGASVIAAQIFSKTPEEAFAAIQYRDRKVPLDIIKAKHEELEKNKKYLRLIFNYINYT